MKESFNFKDVRDLYENIPNNKRPKDILIEGKSIFEYPKSPAQIEMIKTATRLVGSHMQKLGIQQIPFDEKRIVFMGQQAGVNSAEYNDADFFTLDESSEANLGTNVHELIHGQSAEWRNYEEEKVEKFLEKTPGSVKTGFHRNWPGKLGAVNFKNLNEGITEKIAREILADNPDENARLKPLFEGRMEQVIAERERKFREELIPKRIQRNKGIVADHEKRIEELKQRSAKTVAEIDSIILKTTDENEKKRLMEIRNDEEEELAKDIQSQLSIMKLYEKNDSFYEGLLAAEIKGIKSDYSFSSAETTSYDFNVRIIENLIEGITRYNHKKDSKLITEEERNETWKELQKAYFLGKTVWLRKIEEVFGSGFLRKIEGLEPSIKKDEQVNFLNEMKQKIESL